MEQRFNGDWQWSARVESGGYRSESDGVRFQGRTKLLFHGSRSVLETPLSSPPAVLGGQIVLPPPPPPPPSNNSNSFQTLDPNVVIILVVLLFALICAAFLNTVMRCLLRRSHNRRVEPPALGDQSVEGLDAKTLESLPVFTFKSAEKSKEAEADCTICLSEFVDNERLRLLPNCGHTFHLDCIDMWLLSHVSCPVCRDAIGDDPNAHSIIVGDNDDEMERRPHDRAVPSMNANQQLQLAEGDGTNLRAELLRDASSAAITVSPDEALGSSRRTLRSAIISMFSSDPSPPRYHNDASTSYSPALGPPALPARSITP